MDLKEYQELCKKTAKTNFKSSTEEIMTWGLGIAGEAGDVASCIKKTVIHKNDQIQGIRENLGDTMWYLCMICNYYNWDLRDLLQENVDKLEKRYPTGFTYKDAQRNNTKIDWNEDEQIK